MSPLTNPLTSHNMCEKNTVRCLREKCFEKCLIITEDNFPDIHSISFTPTPPADKWFSINSSATPLLFHSKAFAGSLLPSRQCSKSLAWHLRSCLSPRHIHLGPLFPLPTMCQPCDFLHLKDIILLPNSDLFYTILWPWNCTPLFSNLVSSHTSFILWYNMGHHHQSHAPEQAGEM